jgi:hypothetical protein
MRSKWFIITFLITSPLIGICAENSYFTHPVPDSSYFGNAVVTYTIKGKKTTIRNILQTEGQNITALHLNAVSLIPKQGLVKVNFTNSLTHEVFEFVVADKGKTVIQHYKPRITVQEEKKAAYMSENLVNYYAENCTIDISMANEKHVVGKFSGDFISDDGKHVHIKRGSFDIPISER